MTNFSTNVRDRSNNPYVPGSEAYRLHALGYLASAQGAARMDALDALPKSARIERRDGHPSKACAEAVERAVATGAEAFANTPSLIIDRLGNRYNQVCVSDLRVMLDDAIKSADRLYASGHPLYDFLLHSMLRAARKATDVPGFTQRWNARRIAQ